MKREDLSTAVGNIRTEYIEEAAEASSVRPKTGLSLKRILPIAASLVLLATAVFAFWKDGAFLKEAPAAPCAPPDNGMQESAIEQEKEDDSFPNNQPEKGQAPDSCYLPTFNRLESAPLVPGANMTMIDPGDVVPIQAKALAEYYGVSLPLSPLLPEMGLELREEEYSLIRQNGKVLIDQNRFLYEGGGKTVSLALSKDSAFCLPSYTLPLPLPPELSFTSVNGRELVIFSYTEENTETLYLEWTQEGLCWRLAAAGLTNEEFLALLRDLISSETVPGIHTLTGTVSALDPTAKVIGLTPKEGPSLTLLASGEMLESAVFGKEMTVTYRGEPAFLRTLAAPQILSLEPKKG